MSKFLKIAGAIVILYLIFAITNKYIRSEVKEIVLNKELEVIKPSWKGNLKIGDEFVNFNEKDKQIMPGDIFKWKVLSTNPQKEEKCFPILIIVCCRLVLQAREYYEGNAFVAMGGLRRI